MSDVPAKDLESALGKQHGGPAGFGVNYVVPKAQAVSADNLTVELKLDEKSHEAAVKRNNGGENKEFSKAREKKLRQGSLKNLSEESFNKLKKHGLTEKVERVMARAPAKMVNDPLLEGKAGQPLDPLKREKQKHFERVADQLDKIPKTRKVGVNPQKLPEPVQEKLIVEAIEKGQTATAFGQLDTPETLPPAVAGNAKVKQAYKVAHASKSLDAAYKKWGDTLIPGSVEGEMKLKRT